jgi:Arc/MetJ-type ribon-helix-helix transcriptional regulator
LYRGFYNDKKKARMNIRLTSHGQELLEQQLALGQFRSPEEVIERPLETLSERAQQRATMNLAEFEATLDAPAEGSERLPVLPPEATTRAGIYRDHD